MNHRTLAAIFEGHRDFQAFFASFVHLGAFMWTTLVPKEAVATILVVGWFNSGSIAFRNFDGFRIGTNFVALGVQTKIDVNASSENGDPKKEPKQKASHFGIFQFHYGNG
jgi:hypothetical protein